MNTNRHEYNGLPSTTSDTKMLLQISYFGTPFVSFV